MLQPKLFDHYRVCPDENGNPRELGRGAMGVTYLANDCNLQRKVALKVIAADSLDDTRKNNFAKEARAAALLRHPNVAAVHHLGANDAHFFYAMEYVDGETAEAWVSETGPMSTATALSVALQVSRALAAAARQGLAHRDIKPANLMLCTSADGEWPTVKVIDFGLAHSAASGPEDGFHGSAQYASPEQALQQPVDSRSDVYSLGCVLWFLLTGEPPFMGSFASVLAQQLNSKPPFEKLPRLPKAVRRLLEQMLQKNRDQRPEPHALTDAMQRCLVKAERGQAFSRRFYFSAGGLVPHRLNPKPLLELVPRSATFITSSLANTFAKYRRPGRASATEESDAAASAAYLTECKATALDHFAPFGAAEKQWASLRPKTPVLAAVAVVILASALVAAGVLLPASTWQMLSFIKPSTESHRPLGVPEAAGDVRPASNVAAAQPLLQPRTESKVVESLPPAAAPNGGQNRAPQVAANTGAASPATVPSQPASSSSRPSVAENPAPLIDERAAVAPAQKPAVNPTVARNSTLAPSSSLPVTNAPQPAVNRPAPASDESARRLPDGSVLAPFVGVNPGGHWVVAVPEKSTPAQTARTIAAKKKDLGAKRASRTTASGAMKHRAVRKVRSKRRHGTVEFVIR